MKKSLLSLACLASAVFTSNAVISPAITPDPAIESRVNEILSGMTLEQKVGQMCEINIDCILNANPADGYSLDMAKALPAFRDFKVGSILNVPFGEACNPLQWHSVISEIQNLSMEYIGIPDIYGVDQIHGTTYTAGGTLFPQEVNMGASFNRGLVHRAAQISAYESRAASIPWIYAPIMDIGRDSRWSRLWESFGEDAYLNGAMAAEMVRGYQGDDPNHIGLFNVAACAKHYMGYGAPRSGKDRTPAVIAPNELREKYFEPFRQAVKAGALSLMVNSGSINGMPVHADRVLLTEWLKEGLNWDGMIVTDWADIHNLYNREHIARDYKHAIELAVNAGVDMSMTPYDTEFCTLLAELVKEGRVTMKRIDDAVARILRLKLRCGLWERPVTDFKNYPLFASKEHSAVALELACQSEVLLKNNNSLLPLKKGTKILVTGPNANSIRSLNGGWSYTWQGTDKSKFTEPYNTIFEALVQRFGKKNVKYVAGVEYDNDGTWHAEKNIDIPAAVAAAADVNVIVACIGENSYCETPGNLTDLTLSANQSDLVKALATTGKPIILVINSGRPRLISHIEPLATAVIDIMLPGNYGGDALARLLAGDSNFSALLPFTYPKEISSYSVYDYKPAESVGTMDGAYNYSAATEVQWEFGAGLSYTSFEYSDMKVTPSTFTAADTLTVSINVKNTGHRGGMTPVLLYSSDLVASLTPDVRRLRDFTKISLEPGQSKTVTFSLPASALAFVNRDGNWVIEEGDFVLRCGSQSVKTSCSATSLIQAY